MKRNSWKTLLSVVLLLTMLVSMLPFAAFAEDDQTANTQAEEVAKTEGDTKVEENTGNAPKADDKSGAAKTDETSGAGAKDAAKDESKDSPEDDTKNTPKDESKDESKGDAVKDESKGDTENPPMGGTADPNAQIATLEADDPQLAEVVSKITLTYSSNYPTGENDSTHEASQDAMDGKATFTIVSPDTIGFTAPDGYTFNGWNTQADGTGEAVAVGREWAAEHSTTLYAQWGSQWQYYATKEISIAYYPGSFSTELHVSDRANVGENYTIKGSDTFKPPSNMHFVNWKETGSGETYDAGQQIMVPDKNLELLAQWENDPTWSALDISISAPKEELPGTNFNYRIEVTNSTGVALKNVWVDVTLPEEVTPGDTLLDGNWVIGIDGHTAEATFHGTLAAGDTSTFSIPVTIKKDVFGTITAIAKIKSAASSTAGEMPGDIPKNSASAKTTMAGLDISVSPSPSIADIGQTFSYTVTVTNNTGIDLESLYVYNTPPQGFNYSRNTDVNNQANIWVSNQGGDRNSLLYSGNNGKLKNGDSAFYIIETKFTTSTKVTTAVNKAAITQVTSENGQTVTSGLPSAEATVTLKQPDWLGLTITKEVNKATAKPGALLIYTITVENNTGNTLTGVTVEDSLPIDKVSCDGYGCDVSNNYSYDEETGLFTCTVSSLANGGKAIFSLYATIKKDVDVKNAVENTAKIAAAKSNSVYSLIETHPDGISSNTVTTDILTENVPVRVNVEFQGLDDVSQVPANYTLTGDTGNAFFAGTVGLGDAANTNGHISRSFSTTADVVLVKEYALNFTQTGYEVPGYTAALETTPVKATANDAAAGLNFQITITYTKTLSTYKALTVRTYFEGVSELPANFGYTLNCTNSPVEAQQAGFDGPVKLVSKGLDANGVPYMEFSAPNVRLQTGVPLAFEFAQDKYDIDGYNCTPGTCKFTKTLSAPATDAGEEVVMEIRNVYTPKTQEMDATVTVNFVGLGSTVSLPAGYKLTGDSTNEFLKGEIALTKNETADTAVYTGKIAAVPGKEYTLKFAQSGYDVPGYICTPGSLTFTQTPTADNKAINVVIALNYVKENLYTYPSVTVRTYFKGLTKLPDNFGYKLTCTSAPEEATAFLTNKPLTVTKSGVEKGVPYMEFTATDVTLQAGVDQTFSFTQSGYDVPGYVCALGLSTFKFKLELPTTDVQKPIQMNITNTYTQPDWSKLTITKAADKTRAMPGSVVKYTVTVTNNTGVDLSNIVIADKLDSDLRYSDSTGNYSTGTGTWTVASLANGKSVTLTLTVKLKYALTAGTVIDNTATVTSAAAGGQTYDLSSLKLSDSVSVTVTSGKGSPRTGDESNLGLWIAVMAASLACAGAAAVIYKKRRG